MPKKFTFSQGGKGETKKTLKPVKHLNVKVYFHAYTFSHEWDCFIWDYVPHNIFSASDTNCEVLFAIGKFLLVERPRGGKVMEKLTAKGDDMTASCSKFSDIHFSYSRSHSNLGFQLLPLKNYDY